MGFRASQLKSIKENLGDIEYKRILNTAKYCSYTQMGQRVAEVDTKEFDFATQFLSKLKNNVDTTLYSRFLVILRMYKRDRSGTIRMYKKVEELFLQTPELFHEFQKLLPDPNLGIMDSRSIGNTMPMTSPEESAFFQRVQSVVGSKEVYSEFLSVLNLYNQGIIDKANMVDRVFHFLSKSPDVFKWFCSYVDFKPPKKEVLQNFSPSEFNIFKVNGSYRLEPDSENKKHSGRDELANSVLNDLWVSHPTWKGESSGVGSNNMPENLILNVEDERYTLDMDVLTNELAISILKSIKQQIQKEKPGYKVNPEDIPTTLYKSAIRLVFMEPKDEEMISKFLQSPSVAIPIILHHLESVHEELIRLKQAKNRNWRESFASNFWKALDHQGNQNNNFKNGDKKIINSRYILQEAKEIHASKRRLFENENIPQQQEEHIFNFKDLEILKIVLYTMVVHKNLLSSSEYKKYFTWLESFIIPLFKLRFIGNFDDDAVHAHDIQDQFEPIVDILAYPCLIPSSVFVALKLMHLLYSRLLVLKVKKKKFSIAYNEAAINRGLTCLPHPYQDTSDNRFETLINYAVQFIQTFASQNTFDQHCMNCYGLDGFLLTTIDTFLQCIGKSLATEDFNNVLEMARNGNVNLGDVQNMLRNTTNGANIFKMDVDFNEIKLHLLDENETSLKVINYDNYIDPFLVSKASRPIDIKNTLHVEKYEIYEVELKNGKSYKLKLNTIISSNVDAKNELLSKIGLMIDKIEELCEFQSELNKLLASYSHDHQMEPDEMWFRMEEM